MSAANRAREAAARDASAAKDSLDHLLYNICAPIEMVNLVLEREGARLDVTAGMGELTAHQD